MKKWNAFVQINADDTSNYYIEEFDVTDDQYAALKEAVKTNTPIKEITEYEDILKLAEDNAPEYGKVIERWPGINDEDDFFLYDVIVEDPVDMTRFKSKFIGRPLEEDETFEIEEDDERIIYYEVEVTTEDGLIADLDISVCAIEMFGIRANYTSEDAYPDYELIAEELEAELTELEE